MIDVHLAEQAALYAVGALTADERDLFEIVLEFHGDLRAHVSALLEVTAAAALAHLPAPMPQPCLTLKDRILAAAAARPQSCHSGLVVTGSDRRVQWVNPAFTAMCGYTLAELEGQSLGPLLQGEKTDRAIADHMRDAVRDSRPCHETILNYHKDGTPYWVEIDIRPFLGDAGEVRWLIARERERTDLAIPA